MQLFEERVSLPLRQLLQPYIPWVTTRGRHDDERETLRRKFDVAYLLGKKSFPFENILLFVNSKCIMV